RGVKPYDRGNSGRRARSMVGLQRATVALAIGDFGRQGLGLLDPAHDELLGRQEANEDALLVETGLGSQQAAPFWILGLFQQPVRRSDSQRLQLLELLHIKTVDM